MTSGQDEVSDEFDAAALVSLTSALVRVRTVHDSESAEVEARAAELLATTMRGFGWDVRVTEVAPGRPNVVAQVHGAGPGRTLMFEGHLDVVTEADPDL